MALPLALLGGFMYYKKKQNPPIVSYNIGGGNKTGILLANQRGTSLLRANNGKIINVPRTRINNKYNQQPLFSANDLKRMK